MRREYFTVPELGLLLNELKKFEGSPKLGTVEYLKKALSLSYLEDNLLLKALSSTRIVYDYADIMQDTRDVKESDIILVFEDGLNTMPLYINDAEPVKTIANWRLRIGK